MTLEIKHAFPSLKSDGVDTSLVQPSNWNAGHTITMAAFTLVGRGSGAGAATEIPFDTVGVPVGTVLPFAGSSIPSKYLLCAGQAVSRATYADLFTAIGTTYGVGDGSTTFNLPDLRGRVIAGRDDMNGSAASRLTATTMSPNGTTLGAAGGTQTHTLTQAQLPNYNLSFTGSGGQTFATFNNGDAAALSLQDDGPSTVFSRATITIPSGGSGSAHLNTQPTMIMNQMIKALAV